MYYIYHIPGKKVGVTRNLERRVTKEQGYKPSEYTILHESDDIDEVSMLEEKYQRWFGYKTDFNSYKTINNQFKKGSKMSINITDQTVTFPVAKLKLKEYLAANTGFKFMIDNTEIRLDQKVQDWIVKNARVSHFRDTRSYVYNKSLVSFIEELVVEHTFKAGIKKAKAKTDKTVFDKIRDWASDRGIYDKGDSKTQFVKLMEEAGELSRALLKQQAPEVRDAIGDMVVVLTNLAELEGVKIEACIEDAYKIISNRQGSMINGSFVKKTI